MHWRRWWVRAEGRTVSGGKRRKRKRMNPEVWKRMRTFGRKRVRS